MSKMIFLDVASGHTTEEISKEELGEATGFSVSGGTFGSYLSVLRRNDLIKVEGRMVSASKTLFLEGKNG